jgi:putative flippase GtrA
VAVDRPAGGGPLAAGRPGTPVASVDVRLVEPLSRRMTTTWRTLLKELGAFGVVGATCFVLDVVLFQVLYSQTAMGAVPAKLVAAVVSMTAAFIGHRYWSFSHRARTGVRREYLLFAVVNAAALLLNIAIIWAVRYPLGQDSAFVLQVANIAGIALGTAIRYLSYRRWVFPAIAAAEPIPVPAGAGRPADEPAA